MRFLSFACAFSVFLASFGMDDAVSFVKSLERFRGNTYRDAGGRRTIGYGNTSAAMVGKGSVCIDEASQSVVAECNRIAGLLRKEFGGTLLKHEEIALVSFVYNVGWTGFCRSRMFRLLKAGHRGRKVANEFGRWVYFTRWGRKFKSEGLRIRRQAEAEMFMGGSPSISA